MARTRKLRKIKKKQNKRNTKKGGSGSGSRSYYFSAQRNTQRSPSAQHEMFIPTIYIRKTLERLNNIQLHFHAANDNIIEILNNYCQIIKLEREFNEFIKEKCSVTCQDLKPITVLQEILKLKDSIDSKIKEIINFMKQKHSILTLKELHNILKKIKKKYYHEFDQILLDAINAVEIISNKLIEQSQHLKELHEQSQHLKELYKQLYKIKILFPDNSVINELIVKINIK